MAQPLNMDGLTSSAAWGFAKWTTKSDEKNKQFMKGAKTESCSKGICLKKYFGHFSTYMKDAGAKRLKDVKWSIQKIREASRKKSGWKSGLQTVAVNGANAAAFAANKAMKEAIGLDLTSSRSLIVSMTFKSDLAASLEHDVPWDWSMSASYSRGWASALDLSIPGTGNSFSSKISMSLSNDYSKLFNTLMWYTRKGNEANAFNECLKCLDDPLTTGKVFCKDIQKTKNMDKPWFCTNPSISKQFTQIKTGISAGSTTMSLGQMRKYTQERSEGPTDTDFLDLVNPDKADTLRMKLCDTKRQIRAQDIIFDAFRCDKVQQGEEESLRHSEL
jgi:hypothetical protein